MQIKPTQSVNKCNRKPLLKNGKESGCQSDNKPQNLINMQFTQSLPIHKGMLSMNSSTLQKGPEITKNQKLTDTGKNLSFHNNNKTDTTDITHYNLSFSTKNNIKMYQVEHLELAGFKINLCQLNQPHSHKHCPFFHNNKDRKRIGNFYSAEMCEKIENNQPCLNAESCTKAHNRVEQLYRVQPDNYKTKFCTFYPNNIHNCEYGEFCSFAHSEEDISIELIHNLQYDDDFFIFYYKTVWCPFNLTQHDKALCVYAHNWQDFRRKSQVFLYQPIACVNWKTTDFITEYSEGCSESFNCGKCHGWKELEYHPSLFRTKQCLNTNCNKMDCSFYHSNIDKRLIHQQQQFKVFKIVPRNRIIKNTFKVRWEQMNNSQNYSQQLSADEIRKPMYLSQQQISEKTIHKEKSKPLNNDTYWLGRSSPQNSSMCLDNDTKSEDSRQFCRLKNLNVQPMLLPIQERADSDDLKELMRKRSCSEAMEKLDFEDHVRCVLNMIDLDN